MRTLADRRVHHVALNEIVFATTATKSVAEWEAILKRHDVPHAPILGIGAALAHPHTLAREMVVTTEHPTAGTIRMTGRPVKYTGAPQVPLEAPRLLGQDTAEVLRAELGLGDDELRALADTGAISTGAGANAEGT